MLRRIIILLIIISLWGFPTMDAAASGPGVGGRRVRLENEPAGPYLIRVVTSPTPPTVENFNVEVRVLSNETQREVLDASVRIIAEPVDLEALTIEEVATHDYAPLPTEYAAHLAIPKIGLWMVRIEVESDLGFGEVSFYQQVSNPPNIGAIVSIGAPVGGLVLLIIVFFWLQRHSKANTIS